MYFWSRKESSYWLVWCLDGSRDVQGLQNNPQWCLQSLKKDAICISAWEAESHTPFWGNEGTNARMCDAASSFPQGEQYFADLLF